VSTATPLLVPRIDQEVRTDESTELEPGDCAHIVKVGPGETAAAKITEARIFGTPIEALCGYVWVPSKNPRNMPVCPKCKDIYDMYRAFPDGLNESPTDA
jgi:Protein of unknown function (DUF3039)